jgi:hypothetical protein
MHHQSLIAGREFSQTLASERVDSVGGIIHGVSVITEGPALGHVDKKSGLPVFVDRTTLAQVMACAKTYAGGLKVKADHGSGIFATTGALRNFRIDGDRLRADLHVLASDTNRAKLLEMAQTIPDTFGLSVSFTGQDEIRPGKVLARCTEIYSADLVPEPAANPSGLFSKGDGTPSSRGASLDVPNSELLARLADLPETALIELDSRQLNFLSTITVGSFAFRIAGLTLQPDIPGSRFFSVRNVRQFLDCNRTATNERLAGAGALLARRST